jgi:hypothetical protein
MCTIMIIPGIKPENSDKAWTFAKAARPLLTKDNDHAFGYAALGPNGLFAERWTDVNQAFKPSVISSRGSTLLRTLLGQSTAAADAEYSIDGVKVDSIHAMILHARYATTGGHGIENAHPFVHNDTALIHNGMINNHDQLTKIKSTCDSETILSEYLSKNLSTNPKAMQDLADRLAGWYAVAVLAPNPDYGYILDVFRSYAGLHAAYVAELDTVVFATKPHLIKQAAKQCGFTCGSVAEVPEDLMIRINPYTGELISHVEFTSGMLDAVQRYDYSGYAEIQGERVDPKMLPIKQDTFTREDIELISNRMSIFNKAADEEPEAVDHFIAKRSPKRRRKAGKSWRS